MGTGTVYLMYHELQVPSRALCLDDPGYLRYVIPQADFQAQVSWLKRAHWRGISVGEALQYPPQHPRVAITFDDGCETDLLVAAPLLKQAGFNATFYVVAGYLGRRGYLTPVQLRELTDLGFEVGCHSMTHAYLSDLGTTNLHTEMVDAKDRLEQIIGKNVDHLSCPGGRWSRRVASLALEAAYKSVATSRVGANSAKADRFCLSRIAILRSTPLTEFEALCNGKRLFARTTQEGILSLAKQVLRTSTYEKVRSALLR